MLRRLTNIKINPLPRITRIATSIRILPSQLLIRSKLPPRRLYTTAAPAITIDQGTHLLSTRGTPGQTKIIKKIDSSKSLIQRFFYHHTLSTPPKDDNHVRSLQVTDDNHVRSHQAIVKKNLAAFILKQTDNTNHELATYLTKHGFCFGFTVCNARMEFSKRLTQWDKFLDVIAQWDGSIEKLNDRYQLSPKEKSISLKEIFEDVLKNILSCYVTDPNYKTINPSQFIPKNVLSKENDQDTHLAFTKPIKKMFSAGGNLTYLQLNKILDETAISNNLCMLSSPSHVIRISYNAATRQWITYNSNYSITEKRKFFDTKAALFNEIKKIFNRYLDNERINIGIHIASFEHQDKALDRLTHEFSQIVKLNPVSLLQQDGVYMMIKHDAESFLRIINRLPCYTEAQQLQIIKLISDSLGDTTHKLITVMHSIALYDTNCFIAIINLAIKEQQISGNNLLIKAIAQHIQHAGPNGLYIPLHYVAKTNPTLLTSLLAQLKNENVAANVLNKIMNQKNQENETCYDLLNQVHTASSCPQLK